MATDERPADPDAAARLERLTRLLALTASFSVALTPEEVARSILGEGLGALGAKAGNVFWVGSAGRVELLHAFGLTDEQVAGLAARAEALGLPSVEALRTGRPVFLESQGEIAARHPDLAEGVRALGDHAWVGLPLWSDGMRGGLGLRFDEPRRFDAEEREFLGVVARHCAQAIERARLYAAEKATAARLASLQETTANLAGALTPREVAAVVFRALLGLGTTNGGLFHLAPEETLELVFAHGADPETERLLARVPLHEPSPPTDAARTGEAIFLEGAEAIRARYPALEGQRARRGDGSWVAVPLEIEGRPVGALAFTLPEGTPLRPGDRELVLTLARLGAQALERARLYEAQARQNERMSHLHGAAAVLSGAATPAEVAEAAAHALGQLGASVVELYALAGGGERLERVAASGTACGGPEPRPVALDAAHPAAEVARTGRALWIEDDADFAARFPELVAERAASGVVGCALVPLLAGGRTLGVLLAGFRTRRVLSPEDRGYVRLLALPCAYALERAVWRRPTPGPLPAIS